MALHLYNNQWGYSIDKGPHEVIQRHKLMPILAYPILGFKLALDDHMEGKEHGKWHVGSFAFLAWDSHASLLLMFYWLILSHMVTLSFHNYETDEEIQPINAPGRMENQIFYGDLQSSYKLSDLVDYDEKPAESLENRIAIPLYFIGLFQRAP